MPELTDLLRDEFRTAAHDVAPSIGLDRKVQGRVRHRVRRRRAVTVGAVVAVLVLSALAVPRALGGGGPDVMSGPADRPDEHAGLYLVLGWPDEFRLDIAMELTFPDGGRHRGGTPIRSDNRSAEYRAGDRSLAVSINEAPAASGLGTSTTVPDPTSRPVTVRGKDGWVISAPRLLSPVTGTEGLVIVRWEERPGASVSVTGWGVPEPDVLRAAEELRSVSAEEWHALVGSVLVSLPAPTPAPTATASTIPGAATTTATTTATATTTTATTTTATTTPRATTTTATTSRRATTTTMTSRRAATTTATAATAAPTATTTTTAARVG